MTMKRTLQLAAVAAAILALLALAPACSVFDDDITGAQTSRPSILVFGTDAPGDVTELRVELIDARVYADAHDDVGEPLVPLGEDSTVDLVAAAASGTPGLFNEFGVPEGSWNCASGTLALVGVKIHDANDTEVECTTVANVPDSVTVPKLCLRSPVIVNDGETADMVFDLPVLRGEVLDGNGTCELEFDRAGARLMRLADF